MKQGRGLLIGISLGMAHMTSGCAGHAPAAVAAAPAAPTQAFAQLLDAYWQNELREDPLLATEAGDHRYDAVLPGVAPQDYARRAAAYRAFLQQLTSFDEARLSPADRVNFQLLKSQLTTDLESIRFREYEIPITSDGGFHTDFSRIAEAMPFETTRDYENYIARLRAYLNYSRQQIVNMRAGLERGFSLPQAVLADYAQNIQALVVANPEQSDHFLPFRQFPIGVPTAQRARLLAEGRRAISEAALLAYSEFLRFMTNEYIPRARLSLGADALPEGAAYYRYLIREHTTLDLDAGAIHQLGLGEVQRIRRAMEEIVARLNQAGEFRGDFAAFLTFLRTDPRFYAKSSDELLKTAAFLAKKADGILPGLFNTLPRQPYTVEAVPANIAPKYTGGRYIGTGRNSHQPGRYWVNTYELASRPLYVLPALTLHEAVPGHHLENALRLELANVPEFRRFSNIDAYGEGWGLYSEWLGIEAGMYTTLYEHFGRLTYEMWRACRLVVDTGLHAVGWTREQAVAYLLNNTALSEHEVQTEVDRYISWPGQALAYKLGELKIRELRRYAEAQLGTRFDVREFHDTLLRYGPVPLGVLDAQVKTYVAAALARR